VDSEGVNEPEQKIFKHLATSQLSGAIIYSVEEEQDSVLTILTANISLEVPISEIEEDEQMKEATTDSEPVLAAQVCSEMTLYPNPATNHFTVKYKLTKKTEVKVEIFTEEGALVKRMVNQQEQYPAQYEIPVELNDLPAGVYIVKLEAGEEVMARRLIIE
jgi:hypothetical protein